MGIALGIAGLVGAGINAAGQYEQGQANSAMAAYQSQVAANNAKLATEEGKLDIQAGEGAAFNQGMKTRAIVGQEKAAQGASGVDVNTGSPVAVRAGSESMGMLDMLTIRSNEAKRAWAAETQATSDTAQSKLDTIESSQYQTAGDLGAAGTLLSNASTVGLNWANYQKQWA